ncbi:Hpt domain-containing protein [Pedobacter sp. LMG 31464]|uniref:Hpt domain-containing protein n=1 Tax=Pedobacter planticolens TaxID=2679964 RepID=A0A923DUY6_9SPHI|nr:Hpt domain-containing protein [Pedobacter planticolens]MBB2144362.1 Hpt domain-containing protein [Pedobacter planticolens]
MIDEQKNNQPLNLSYLRDMSGDSADFMIEMLEAFQKQTPIYMADLERAIHAQDWKATSEYAHKMKPTFYYVGREDVRDHIQEIERNSRELRELESIPTAFQEAKEFVDILYKQLDDAKVELQKQL